ncbi:NAD(P)-dependent oxidoreductase [Sphingobium sp. HWE2-09]|uniref:NAD(P)-dependent oxidoreductase n=1 Tax=Sphingobium sp. HWE2-09 TaxID=3108390 RepID=UPI002DCAA537|nr:NAD(P)-dependent oxidoreductase [Sphingobium sp. HWE2-09]
MKVGLIGLGQMGKGMAVNLLAAGYEVTVWNRSVEKCAELASKGALVAARPIEAAQGDVIMTMLADDKAVEQVVYGEHGIQDAPAIHISHSTISVSLAERLSRDQADQAGFISAPVFGRPAAAAAGQLFVVAAGDFNLIQQIDTLFSVIGQRYFNAGPHAPAANIIKLNGNFMVMSVIEALSESLAIIEQGGIDGKLFLEILTNTLFSAPVYKTYGDILIEKSFWPAGFAAPLGLKDINLLHDVVERHAVKAPFLSVIRDNLDRLIAFEGKEIDWSGVGLLPTA